MTTMTNTMATARWATGYDDDGKTTTTDDDDNGDGATGDG